MITIDAKGLDFKALNQEVRRAVESGEARVTLRNVNGQRYIGCGLKSNVRIDVHGVPGSDMAAFMDGPEIRVHANAESAIGNTMNAGRVVIDGSAGDVVGYAMRGGRIYVRGNVGYRVGIHMKSFRDRVPVVVVGGRTQDFLGEYMAGGMLVVLGLDAEEGEQLVGRYAGTGLHGGAIFIRGDVADHQLGEEVSRQELTREDERTLRAVLKNYCAAFRLPLKDVTARPFVKLAAVSHRPYGRLYAY